ncbi:MULTISPECIES: hypothetical protein [Tenebrionibacter/Tenebrionicola group]|jgi:hypothetical protein|uniref:Lipoprotein n=2 Tax=Tenebrionibacter/Tenebrionicola group TaxID=2969848 RepID=A0A8K0XXP2_9ENTR|nr:MULTISPECIES: hypothetical protein [Tenebrionibacter/Tenebrionicola group]MBK4716805.1 hypothetical protein [Tenebrionibacter intestinalis]MBV5097342.1 hypothetical protein [Tenebrionicola larvae]
MRFSLAILVSLIFLSGCSVDMSRSMPDYQGSDKAFIRVDNTFQPTPFRLEKMLPSEGCVKSDGVYGLTAKIAIMGIKSSYTRRVNGIASPSETFLKRGYLEYIIQSGYVYKIWWRFEERSMYGIDLSRTFTSSFMAKDGHTYEVQTKGNDIVIHDLTDNEDITPVNIKECKYKKTLLGKKEYL